MLEVIIALFIALLMLTALFSLEIKTTELSARVNLGIDTLPLAISNIEDVSKENFVGNTKRWEGNYEIHITSHDSLSEIPYTRVSVEVLYRGEEYSHLSIYRFKTQ